jgi:hypothetical protein
VFCGVKYRNNSATPSGLAGKLLREEYVMMALEESVLISLSLAPPKSKTPTNQLTSLFNMKKPVITKTRPAKPRVSTSEVLDKVWVFPGVLMYGYSRVRRQLVTGTWRWSGIINISQHWTYIPAELGERCVREYYTGRNEPVPSELTMPSPEGYEHVFGLRGITTAARFCRFRRTAGMEDYAVTHGPSTLCQSEWIPISESLGSYYRRQYDAITAGRILAEDHLNPLHLAEEARIRGHVGAHSPTHGRMPDNYARQEEPYYPSRGWTDYLRSHSINNPYVPGSGLRDMQVRIVHDESQPFSNGEEIIRRPAILRDEERAPGRTINPTATGTIAAAQSAYRDPQAQIQTLTEKVEALEGQLIALRDYVNIGDAEAPGTSGESGSMESAFDALDTAVKNAERAFRGRVGDNR